MPSSSIRTSADADEFSATVRTPGTVVTVTSRGRFTGTLARIDLHSVWMQRGAESLPRILQADHSSSRFGIVFNASSSGQPIIWNGVEAAVEDLALVSPGTVYSYRTLGALAWGSISLPATELAALSDAIVGRDLTPAKHVLTLTPAPGAMATLRRLHAAAGQLAETAPEVIANPEAARALDQLLTHAFLECLDKGQAGEPRLAQGRHGLIIRRLRRVLDDNPDRALYVPELCASIGVADRTLRVCCQTHLGMSPKRYLLLRRLHLAHRTLRDSLPSTSSVTEIATRYGFWELGRFAGAYKALFGEAPLMTLQRPVG